MRRYVSVIETATLLSSARTAPGVARRFVRDALQGADVEIALVETVELLTSELVTNVVIHVGSASELAIRSDEGMVRVEVSDPDPHQPEARPGGPGATHGRGLGIVETLADAWGVELHHDDGKTIWFELRAPLGSGAHAGDPAPL